MTAQEMFEKFNCYEDEKYIVYRNNRYSITFDKVNKEYWHSEETSITVDEHQAITQQMKELGWIE